MSKKEELLVLVKDAVSDLLYYNRKEDDKFPVGVFEEAIDAGIITHRDIVDAFSAELRKQILD